MTGYARFSDCLPAVLSAAGPATAEGPATAGGFGRIGAPEISTEGAESGARPRILSNSTNLVEIMMPSLQECLFSPILSIFDENQPNQAK
jgi:hypothetical protein